MLLMTAEELIQNPGQLKTIKEMGFTARTHNCLENDGVKYVFHILWQTKAELMRIPGFGKLAFEELAGKLAAEGCQIAAYSEIEHTYQQLMSDEQTAEIEKARTMMLAASKTIPLQPATISAITSNPQAAKLVIAALEAGKEVLGATTMKELAADIPTARRYLDAILANLQLNAK